MSMESFERDPEKDQVNQGKHGVSFGEAQAAFADPDRVIAETYPTATVRNGITVSERRGRVS
jgi:uncharacterized DUF497 family protein